MAKNSDIMTELMKKYGVSSGSYGGSTANHVSPSEEDDLMQNLMKKYYGEGSQAASAAQASKNVVSSGRVSGYDGTALKTELTPFYPCVMLSVVLRCQVLPNTVGGWPLLRGQLLLPPDERKGAVLWLHIQNCFSSAF